MKHARRRKKRIQKPAVRISAAHLKYPIAYFTAAFILFAGFPYIFSSIFSVPVPVASQQEEAPEEPAAEAETEPEAAEETEE